MRYRKGSRTKSKSQKLDPLTELAQAAIELHKRGNFSDAKKVYIKILRESPEHFDALHLCGVTARQMASYDEAEQYFLRAMKVKSNIAALYSNYALLLNDMRRYDEALANYRRAIAIEPNFAVAYCNLGITLENLRRHSEAVSAYVLSLIHI